MLRVLGETSGTIEPQRSLLLDLIARCYSEHEMMVWEFEQAEAQKTAVKTHFFL